MHCVTLIAVGTLKTDWVRRGCEEYFSRLKDIRFSVRELPASKQTDAAKQRTEECDRILRCLDDRCGKVLVLDETGSIVTSADFASLLEAAADAGDPVTVILGGAYGLDERVKACGTTLRLSSMTFPHELCRLIFMEQLYRARQIAKKTGYHH